MKNNIKIGLCSAVVALATATTAHAFSSQDAIRYSYNGAAFVTAATDTDGDGLISTTIVIGGFNLNVISTQTYPFIGTQAAPNLDLQIQGKGTVKGETLVIEFSAMDFTPVPAGSYITDLGLSDDPTVSASETTRVGKGAPNGDVLFASGADAVSATTIGGASTGGFESSLSAGFSGQVAPYAITTSVGINVTDNAVNNGGAVSVRDHIRVVPDGGNTLMLLGSALSVLGIGAFRKSRKA